LVAVGKISIGNTHGKEQQKHGNWSNATIRAKAITIRKILVAVLTTVMVVSAVGCMKPTAIEQSNLGQQSSSSSIVWKEVESTEITHLSASIVEFDMHQQMATTDFVFRGRILSHQNYEVSWTEEDGSSWGPYEKSVLEVQVVDIYLGKLPVEKDVLRVYYSFSTDTILEGAFALKDGREYVFFGRFFGESHLQENLRGTPYYKDELEKVADIYFGDTFHDALPIENNMIVANVEFDFQRQAVSLANPGSASRLAPESFEFIRGLEELPIIRYSLFSEEYFVSALRQYAEKEDVVFDVAEVAS
jgi:hypothetical protein